MFYEYYDNKKNLRQQGRPALGCHKIYKHIGFYFNNNDI